MVVKHLHGELPYDASHCVLLLNRKRIIVGTLCHIHDNTSDFTSRIFKITNSQNMLSHPVTPTNAQDLGQSTRQHSFRSTCQYQASSLSTVNRRFIGRPSRLSQPKPTPLNRTHYISTYSRKPVLQRTKKKCNGGHSLSSYGIICTMSPMLSSRRICSMMAIMDKREHGDYEIHLQLAEKYQQLMRRNVPGWKMSSAHCAVLLYVRRQYERFSKMVRYESLYPISYNLWLCYQ